MRTEIAIDYLSLTVNKLKGQSPHVHHPALPEDWKPRLKGMFGYTNVRDSASDGRIECVNPDRPEMGTFLSYSGETLRRTAVEPMELLVFHWLSMHKVTRLDIAFDVYDADFTIAEVILAAEEGHISSNAKSMTQYSGIGQPGGTLYIGSTSSIKRMRIYDKAAEQGLFDQRWIRFELQLRKEAAESATDLICSSSNRLVVMTGLIAGFASLPKSLVGEIFDIPVEKAVVQRKVPKTQEWLLTQVAKAAASHIVATGNYELSTVLKSVIDDLVEEIESGLMAKTAGV